MIRLNPKLHKPKDKKSLQKSDVWPCDVIVDGAHKWIMTSEGVAVPYRGYIGYYAFHNYKKDNHV